MFITFVKRQPVRLHTRNTHDGIKMKDLAYKTVLVTGASSGIGRAIALAGCSLVLGDHRGCPLDRGRARVQGDEWNGARMTHGRTVRSTQGVFL